MKPSEFFATYGPAFIAGTEGFKIFPSVKAAQAALETGYGASIKGNNMFGIKAAGKTSPYWKGESMPFNTTEYFNGIKTGVTGIFRKYASLADSIKDHSFFIQQNTRYKAVFEATTPEAQAAALQNSGYATDPRYAEKLIQIIKANNLKALDEKKK